MECLPFQQGAIQTAAHSLFYFRSSAVVVAGGNRINAMGESVSAIKIDGHSLMGFEWVGEQLLLNVDLRDREGESMLVVRRNELVHSTYQWDYTFEGQTLSIRESLGSISLEIKFDADAGEVVIEKGLVSHNGIEVWFDPRGLCILNNRTLLSGSTVTGLDAAIELGDRPGGGTGPVAFHVEVNRGPFDAKAAIEWARRNLKAL